MQHEIGTARLRTELHLHIVLYERGSSALKQVLKDVVQYSYILVYPSCLRSSLRIERLHMT